MPYPWGPEEADTYMRQQVERLYTAIRSAIETVLKEIKVAVLPGNLGVDLGAWSGRSVTWQASIRTGRIAQIIRDIIAHIFGRAGVTDPTTIDSYAQQHIETVWSRLVDWPVEAWADVSQTLADGVIAGDDSRRLRERVGDALDITALTRTAEAEMESLYDRIEAGVSPGEEADLRSRIRELANTADRSRRRWEWRADRISRTEVAGAVNAGVDAYARDSGRAWWRQWWSSLDSRVRGTHRIAHGQVVAPGERFLVGGDTLRYPGDPLGSAREVINCRCSTLLLTESEASDIDEDTMLWQKKSSDGRA